MPDFVIIGAQRSGTTSLYSWLCSHPDIDPATRKELHYFDTQYGRGERWYRSQFPIRRRGRLAGESTPYLLFHPLAPRRAAQDLPDSTRFIVLLRDPVERALSHYWLSCSQDHETEPLARAIDLEEDRLRGETELILSGGVSTPHRRFSYVARGEYAGQLRRWFSEIPRERFLVLESERLFTGPSTGRVTEWLGLPPNPLPFPASNHAERTGESDEVEAVVARLRLHFVPHNQELFELLGTTMWQ
jgi:hypothetical protein